MDDKLLNIIITVVVIGGWVVQFLLKNKGETSNDPFHQQEDEENSVAREHPDYANDPYIQVQEEIRRKIAARKAAQEAAAQQRESSAAPLQRPQAEQRHTTPRSADNHQQPQRHPHPQARPHMSPGRAPASQTPSPQVPIPQAPAPQMRQPRREAEPRPRTAGADHQLRPIPQAAAHDRAFPASRNAPLSPKVAFPDARRSAAGAYQRHTAPRASRAPRNDMIRASLRSPAAARQAMVLREVLGPPVALQNERQF